MTYPLGQETKSSAMIPRVVAQILLPCFLITACAAQNSPGVSPVAKPASESAALPAPFEHYEILPQTTSPDQTLAVIFPRREVALDMMDNGTARLALVGLAPFRLLSDIPVGASALIFGHGSYSVTWMPDSSALLMVQGLKWGPDRVYLGEISGLPQPRFTDLAALATDLVRPAFRASKMTPFNDGIEFIIEGDDGWSFNGAGDVSVDCKFINHPKPGEKDVWQLRWQAVWSRAEKRFTNERRTDP
jgi:hypothetical protein